MGNFQVDYYATNGIPQRKGDQKKYLKNKDQKNQNLIKTINAKIQQA